MFGTGLGLVFVEVVVEDGFEFRVVLAGEDEGAGEEAVAEGVEGGFGFTFGGDGALRPAPVGPGGSALGVGSGFWDAIHLFGHMCLLTPTYRTNWRVMVHFGPMLLIRFAWDMCERDFGDTGKLLTEQDIQQFIHAGYVRIDGAFPRELADRGRS